MAIAATWWALAVMIILIKIKPKKSPYLALAAVAAAAFPIATLAVQETITPSEMQLNAFTSKNDSSPANLKSIQSVVYSVANGTQRPSEIPWHHSQNVAFLNGQTLGSVRFPSLFAEGDVLWQRFLTEDGQTGELQHISPHTPVLDSLVTVYTLGQTRLTDWESSVIIDR